MLVRSIRRRAAAPRARSGGGPGVERGIHRMVSLPGRV